MVIDKDIILSKVTSVQKYLRRMKEVTGLNPDSLDNIDIEDIFVLNLQRAIQVTIDIATHVVAQEGLGVPESLKDNFSKLERKKIISKELSAKMQSMVGFRNLTFHEYNRIDKEVLKSIFKKNLKDTEDFYVLFLKYYKLVKLVEE